jgi:Ca-activated chloride channel homolog
MRTPIGSRTGLAGLFVVAVALGLDAQSFRSGVEVVTVAVTVRDSDGRLVKGLARDAFEVYEDGQRQPVTQFTSERVPVSLGVLLDVSDSMYGERIKDARSAIDRFLFDLLDPSDEFFIQAFNHRPQVVLTGWTTSRSIIRDALEGLRPSGGTAAYDAVLSAVPLLARRSRQRAALLLISDGADTASDHTLADVRAALVRSDAFTYAIAIDPPERRPINTAVNVAALRDVTDHSGGHTEVVRSSADLLTATSAIAEELNSQYVLGYNSPRGPDGDYHSIRVRVAGAGYRVSTRNGYVAVRGRGASNQESP